MLFLHCPDEGRAPCCDRAMGAVQVFRPSANVARVNLLDPAATIFINRNVLVFTDIQDLDIC